MPLNVCMVGYGMMGVWHSEALRGTGAVCHTVVGRRAEEAKSFAARYDYRNWTTSLDSALADPAIDVVVLATPSELHEEQALACFAAGKHVLIEIPIAMTLAGAERVVAAGEASGLVYGLCHPMRFRPEIAALHARLRAGAETLRHFAGRFFIHRLENVGATGYHRSWTDNILWHHFCHFVDLALYLTDFPQPVRVQSHLGLPHAATGIPMECTLLLETPADQSLLVHGSYHASFRVYDTLIVTDRDTYLLDFANATLRTAAGTAPTLGEQENCSQVLRDFLAAVERRHPPRASGPSVLPAMRALQAAQDAWDARHGARALPGRRQSG